MSERRNFQHAGWWNFQRVGEEILDMQCEDILNMCEIILKVVGKETLNMMPEEILDTWGEEIFNMLRHDSLNVW